MDGVSCKVYDDLRSCKLGEDNENEESKSAFLQLLELVFVHIEVELDNDLSLAQMGHPIFQSDASD